MTSTANHFNPSESPNYKFVMPNAPSPNLRAFFAYVRAMEAWNYEEVMACFDESLEHRILPQSIGRPVLNKKQYGEYFKGVMPLFKSFRVSIHEVIEADDKLTVHASSIGVSISDSPFANEYTFIIQFVPPTSKDPDALPRMRFVKEFVDSAASLKFFTEERAKAKAREEQEREERRRQVYRQSSSGSNRK